MGRALTRSLVLGPLVLLLTAGAVLVAAWYYLSSRFDEPGSLAHRETIVFKRGSSAWTIAETLEQAGIIDDRNVFAAGVWLEGKTQALKAGEYAIEPGASPRAVMEQLIAGEVVEHRLTIPEGLTSAQIVALIREAEILAGEVGSVPPEGTLLPETYQYRLGDTRQDVLDRMQNAMRVALAGLWETRATELPVVSPEEAVVLASIVEKETGVPTERPLVAGVFMNRLRRDMRLQSDPTVIYALTGGKDTLVKSLTKSDLEIDSPFNTYRRKGLPPAPIANPGRASLAAVLQPTETDALYFVADGTGGHVFAATLDEHNRNVAQWRKLQRKRAAGEAQP